MLVRTIHRQDGDGALRWLEVVGPALSHPDAATAGDASHLYEYGWTLGFSLDPPDARPERGPVWRFGGRDDPPDRPVAVRVRLLFPVWPDRFVSAQTATVKHVSPVQKEEQWRQRLAGEWNNLAPVVQAAGTVAADVTGLAPLDSVAKAVAGMRTTSVPQTPDALWFVRSVDDVRHGRLHHGVEWELPRALLTEVGTQIGGGLLVSMTAATTAFRGTAAAQDPDAPVLARATLVTAGAEDGRLPATDDPYVELDVFTRGPSSAP